MGFLDRLREVLSGPSGDANIYWIHAQCARCGEPLRGRINLNNELSRAEGGEGWLVRKILMGSGAQRCFQRVEMTLRFDEKKQELVDSQVVGGKLITQETYEALLEEHQAAQKSREKEEEEANTDA